MESLASSVIIARVTQEGIVRLLSRPNNMWFLRRICDFAVRFWLFIFDRLLLYPMMRQLSPRYNIHFMNLGYWPTETSAVDDAQMTDLIEKNSKETDTDRPHYYLYECALKHHNCYPALEGLQILEVGCGQGYGMKWIQKAHSGIETIQGVDTCASLGNSVVPGDAQHLPFPECRFDLVLNVESSHLYNDCGRFFRECRRVLRKGGYLCWTDLRYRAKVNETRRQASQAGFIEEQWDDVTDNVLQGLQRTSARYDKVLMEAPWPVRLFSPSLRATYCAPGTHTYARFATKEKGYYAALWRKP